MREDKRVQVLHLTQGCKNSHAGVAAARRRHEDRFLHRLTRKERATLLRLLRLIWIDEQD